MAALAALAACGGSSTKVSSDLNQNVPFPKSATYAWSEQDTSEASSVAHPMIDNAIVRDRIVSVIDQQMVAKGFRSTDPQTSDFLVHYHLGLQPEHVQVVQQNTYPQPVPALHCSVRACWSAWRWSYWGVPTETTERTVTYTEGTLMIDVVQRSTGTLAWRGIGKRQITPADMQSEAIQQEIADIMKTLPSVK